MTKRQYSLTIVALLSLCGGTAQSASFDCAQARTALEKTLCDSPELSQADASLNTLYQSIKARTKHPDALRRDQLVWMKSRDTCKTNTCILEKYRTREVELNQWLSKEAAEHGNTTVSQCLPEDSARCVGERMAQEEREVSKQLDIQHAKLMTLLKQITEGNSSLMARDFNVQYQSWNKYKSDECRLVGTMTGAGGSWPSTWAVDCEINLVQRRLQQVKSAIRCVQTLPKSERGMSEANCLEPLTPLANMSNQFDEK